MTGQMWAGAAPPHSSLPNRAVPPKGPIASSPAPLAPRQRLIFRDSSLEDSGLGALE